MSHSLHPPTQQQRVIARRKSPGAVGAAPQTAGAAAALSTLSVQAAVLNPHQAAPAQLLEVQRRYGNYAVQRLLTSSTPPDDHPLRDPHVPSLARAGLAGSLQGGALDAQTQARIDGARGGGAPLDTKVGAQVGGALGADFGGVKVHTDLNADALNRSLSAKAFTTGRDIFFSQGAYKPNSSGGKQLLAHELTHVVQQSPSSTPSTLRCTSEVRRTSEVGCAASSRAVPGGPKGGSAKPNKAGPGLNPSVQTKRLSESSAAAGGALKPNRMPEHDAPAGLRRSMLTTGRAPAIQRYVKVPVNSQKPDYYPAGIPLRVSDDGNIALMDSAVFQGGKGLWATAGVIAHAAQELANVGSTLTLEQGANTIPGKVPPTGTFSGKGATRTLYEVMATRASANLPQKTKGNAGAVIPARGGASGFRGPSNDSTHLRTLENCNANAFDIMGVMVGGSNVSFRAGIRDGRIVTDDNGGNPVDISGMEHADREQGFSKAMKTIRAGPAISSGIAQPTADEAKAAWQGLSNKARKALARRLGVNQYAIPEVGDSVTAIRASGNKGAGAFDYHFAPVVAKSGGDYVTLENFGKGAADRAATDYDDWSNAWFYRMYGPYKSNRFSADDDQSYFGEHAAEGSLGNRKDLMGLRVRNTVKAANTGAV